MLHEISRESININKNEGTTLSWHNSVLAVRTGQGIQLYNFAYDLYCLDKKLNFVLSFIPTPKTSPASELFSQKYLKTGLSNLDITQMILDPGLWPHNPQLAGEMANVSAFEWSPAGIIQNNESALAIMNNFGNIDLYGRQRNNWSSILDLSAVIKSHYDAAQKLCYNPNSLEELKQSVDLVETSSFCWGPMFEKKCCFVTGQRSGNILIWHLQTSLNAVTPELQSDIQTEIGEIISMLWIPRSEHSFILVCSNVLGQIFTLDFEVNKVTRLVNTTCLWIHKDRMIAKHLLHSIIDDKIVILCNKNRHLLVQVLDKKCNVISELIQLVNDYKITNITFNNNGFCLSTINGKIYKVSLTITNDALKIDLSLIETKDQYATYELYSFTLSSNNVIWALGMIDRKVMCRKAQQRIEIVFLHADTDIVDEISILLDNPSKKLTNYWDCIELVRVKAMRHKNLPIVIDLKKLYDEGNSDLYKLKVYLIFLILYNSLVNANKIGHKCFLPEVCVEAVRESLLVSHACSLFNTLYSSQSERQLLDPLELETFAATKNFLTYICRKYNRSIDELISYDILKLTREMNLEYSCQCCDEKIDGFSCIDGHLNMFCTLTFTAIENNDYIACRSCNSIARIELFQSKPKCLFCDLYLNQFCIPS